MGHAEQIKRINQPGGVRKEIVDSSSREATRHLDTQSHPISSTMAAIRVHVPKSVFCVKVVWHSWTTRASRHRIVCSRRMSAHTTDRTEICIVCHFRGQSRHQPCAQASLPSLCIG